MKNAPRNIEIRRLAKNLNVRRNRGTFVEDKVSVDTNLITL